MQVGIYFPNHLLNPRMDENARDMSFSKKPAFFCTETTIPPEVEQAIELTSQIWIDRSDIPIFILDKGNHGYDMGLILKEGQSTVLEGNIIASEILARISFGGIRDENGEVDYEDAKRLHINVAGFREFFPQQYLGLPSHKFYEEVGDPEKVVKEVVHVSMRWLDGVYDSWEDESEWVRDRESFRMGRKRFDTNRTTYASASVGHTNRENSTEPLAAVETKGLVERIGRRNQRIPFPKSIDIFAEKHNLEPEAAKKMIRGEFAFPGNSYPLIGWDNVRAKLEDFLPDISFAQMQRMDMMTGIEFLFGEVLPAMERYVHSE